MAVAPIWPLASEFPYAAGLAWKSKKKKKANFPQIYKLNVILAEITSEFGGKKSDKLTVFGITEFILETDQQEGISSIRFYAIT